MTIAYRGRFEVNLDRRILFPIPQYPIRTRAHTSNVAFKISSFDEDCTRIEPVHVLELRFGFLVPAR